MTWPTPAEVAQIGGWCFAAIVCAIIIGGFITGKLVPGWIYQREIVRADKATDLISTMTVSMDRLTGAVEKSITQTDTVVSMLRSRS